MPTISICYVAECIQEAHCRQEVVSVRLLLPYLLGAFCRSPHPHMHILRQLFLLLPLHLVPILVPRTPEALSTLLQTSESGPLQL